VRKILVVGAGQSGLMLAIGLQAQGYDVTIMSARTADEIRGGWPTSTQMMYGPALNWERKFGLNLWEDQAPHVPGMEVSLAAEPGNQAFSFYGGLDEYAISVDQRLKMSTWLELFENRGGRVIYHPVMTSDLVGLVPMYDLTLIAAGRGELVELFDRDATRSRYTQPLRTLSAIYLHGVESPAELPDQSLRANLEPGAGEMFTLMGLTLSGPTLIALIEAVPGGPLDIFRDRPSPTEHLRRLRRLMDEHFPWEGRLYRHAEPTDARASVTGALVPTVRHPAAQVAPGSYVLGMADVVVVNDPIGQGSNSAAHCAGMYLNSIVERGSQPFDATWMHQTFENFWQNRARDVTTLSNFLLEPMPEYAQQIFFAASQYPPVAKRVVGLFAHPEDVHDFLLDREKGPAYVASVAAGQPSRLS
jgi:styrene monooxygenase A-like protein